jgi:3-hydroxyisobutyrate dehydrogenase-like beta-hydroxyacid dehydrogenase
MVAGDDTPHSAVDIFAEDLRIISDIGRAQKLRMPSP